MGDLEHISLNFSCGRFKKLKRALFLDFRLRDELNLIKR